MCITIFNKRPDAGTVPFMGSTTKSGPGSRRTRISARYGCKTLVWYELHDEMVGTITREKQPVARMERSAIRVSQIADSASDFAIADAKHRRS